MAGLLNNLTDKVDAGGGLTIEEFREFHEKALAAAYKSDPCWLGQHTLPPQALREPGIYRCLRCMMHVQT